MKKKLFLPLAVAAMFVTACGVEPKIGLSGEKIQKSFEVSSSYSELEVSSAINVLYSAGAEELVVTADSTVMPYVVVEEKGKVLSVYIPWKKSLKFKNGNMSNVSVVIPASASLEKISVSGASDFKSDEVIRAESFCVEVSGASDFSGDFEVVSDLAMYASGASDIRSDVSAETLEVKATGASDMNVSGKVKNYNVISTGASSVSSGKGHVEADFMTCDISGASGCNAKCNVSATGNVSGASHMTVSGNAEVNISSTGASSVTTR